MITSIHIPHQKNQFPTTITDTYVNILNYVFQTQNVYTLQLLDHDLILSYHDYSYESIINKTATFLYRAYRNDNTHSVLYGPAVLISKNQLLDKNLLERICYIHANL